MNRIIKGSKGYKGGVKGTKFSPLKAAGSEKLSSETVSKSRKSEHKLKY